MTHEPLEPRLHLTTVASFTASSFPGFVRVGAITMQFRYGDIYVRGKDIGDYGARPIAVQMQFTNGRCTVFADGRPLVTVAANEPSYGAIEWHGVTLANVRIVKAGH